MSTRKQQVVSEWKEWLDRGVNTEALQLQALACFLSDIGYFMGVRGGGQVHVFKHKMLNDNPKFIPFDLAVSLYNGTKMKANGTLCEVGGLTFDRNVFHKAVNNRILHTIYLQRYQGKLKVQKHWVKFCEPYDLTEELERTY